MKELSEGIKVSDSGKCLEKELREGLRGVTKVSDSRPLKKSEIVC